MTEQNPNTTGAGLTQSLLPDWNTDHGGFNFGDLLILLFDGILLVYTGWRSFDLLSGTVPAGWEVMAFIGLLALDIGAVIWSYIWIFNSTTQWQDRIAMIFFVIDMSGVALTSITDSLMYGDSEGVMLAMLEPMTMVIIPIIIIANVIAGIVYHFTSADTRARRTKRQLKAKARDEEQRQQDEELQLYYAQQSLLRRQAELPRKIALANLKIAQDQLEKEAMQALFGNGDVERAMGGNIGDSPSADTSLADAQVQLLALQSMGANQPTARTPAPTREKLNPVNWFKKSGAATTSPEALGGDESLEEVVADTVYPLPRTDIKPTQEEIKTAQKLENQNAFKVGQKVFGGINDAGVKKGTVYKVAKIETDDARPIYHQVIKVHGLPHWYQSSVYFDANKEAIAQSEESSQEFTDLHKSQDQGEDGGYVPANPSQAAA